ncbi:twin-arginine translocation signal domain-containing protein, partial [Candidatus Poribacteria bacterium]|nr:twin-arginine translocation signal domain-containing protein [Candidatus Poribacteria bacterium]
MEEKDRITRRNFIKTTGGAIAVASIGANSIINSAKAAKGAKSGKGIVMQKRELGKTGEKLSIIGFGGIVVCGTEQPEANDIVSEAVDRGVNYFDVAPSYCNGQAEERLGPA